ncbi:MAG: helix-turn-helix transcriptional regulator [Flavobacteriaceae bacterium]
MKGLTPPQRIEKMVEHLNISIDAFGKNVTGGRAQGIYDIIDGKTKSITGNMKDKILNKYPIFNSIWLLTGTGNMLKTETNKQKNEVTPVPEDDYMMVQYADLKTSAGNLGGAEIDQLPDTHKRLVPRMYEKGEFLVVRVDGDSMDDGTTRAICDGDEILIKKYELSNSDVLPFRNNLFVINSREGNVVKQIVEHNTKKGTIICHSFNDLWTDYTVNINDVFSFFTVVKIVNRKIKF